MVGATRAGDLLDEAVRSAQEAARRLGLNGRNAAVLDQSNNVVVRVDDIVLKVGADHAGIRREVDVAGAAARAGGPVVGPICDVVDVGPFALSAWPYIRRDASSADDSTGLRALHNLHRALARTTVPLPRLVDRFGEVRDLLDDIASTRALGSADRALLRAAIDVVAADVADCHEGVLHAEPHDRNRLTVGGVVLYIDFEAACLGPVEWDLAYFSDDVVELVWPSHDANLRRRLQVGVSACVSTFCWRHVTARPADNEMLWHAQHHLSRVRDGFE